VFVPAAGAVLADLGADVVKVEPPNGDPLRSAQRSMMPVEDQGTARGPAPYFELANRGKRSVTLDLAAAQGDAGAYDLVAGWAGSGLAHRLTGDADQPAVMPFAFFDAPGGNVLAGAVATALFKRERTGEPSVVDVSLLNVGWWSMQGDISAAPYTEWTRPPTRTSPSNPVVNSYRTADGRWLYLCFARGDRDWLAFCALAEEPSVAADHRFATAETRQRHAADLVAVLDRLIGSRTYADWLQLLERFDGPWRPQASAVEVHAHPQAAANGYLNDHRCADGSELRLVAPPVQFDEAPTRPRGPAPELGRHTDEVLGELGASAAELAALRVEHVV
jgi:formyl-CoA transferase